MDAFPVAVNPLSLDWQSDGYHKLTVTFAYTNWRNNSLENLTMEFLENQIYQNIPPILPSTLGTDSIPVDQATELLSTSTTSPQLEAVADYSTDQGPPITSVTTIAQ